MKLSQIFTAPNQLTLLRMIFVPFIVIHLVDGHYSGLWSFSSSRVSAMGSMDLLARTLHQQTLLGSISRSDCRQTSVEHDVSCALHPAQNSVEVHGMVFSRDISILAASAVLFAIAGLRNFRPSIFGKANTLCQIGRYFSFCCCKSPRNPLDVDRAHGRFCARPFVHHHFRSALRHSGAESDCASIRTHCPPPGIRRFEGSLTADLTHFLPDPKILSSFAGCSNFLWRFVFSTPCRHRLKNSAPCATTKSACTPAAPPSTTTGTSAISAPSSPSTCCADFFGRADTPYATS